MAISDALELRDTIRTDLKTSSFSGRASIDVGSTTEVLVGDFIRLFKVEGNQRIISLKYFSDIAGGGTPAETFAGKLVLLSTKTTNDKIIDLQTGRELISTSTAITAGTFYNTYGGPSGILVANSDKQIKELISTNAHYTPSVFLALEVQAVATAANMRVVYEGQFG